jgi:CDP-diglyceride synthetase
MIVAQVVYLVLPFLVAGVVHSAAIKHDLLHVLARPLDGGLTMAGRPVLGANKTWRGPVMMCAGCLAAVLVQGALYPLPGFETLSLLDYGTIDVPLLGVILGLSYSLAELPNSFVKRRLGIAPGVVSSRGAVIQYVIDQADSVLGGALVLLLILHQTVTVVVLAIVVGFVLHVLFDQAMYATGVKRVDDTPGAFTPAIGWCRRRSLEVATRRGVHVEQRT